MADFALRSTACEKAFCPGGGFLHAYKANRRAAIEDVVEADPVAARIRDIMAERTMWAGNASELLRVGADVSRDDVSRTGAGWPKSPRALAGRLRRAQTPLRALGIEITFGREGRAGTRIIRLKASRAASRANPTRTTVSTVGTVSDEGPFGPVQPPPGPGLFAERASDADGAEYRRPKAVRPLGGPCLTLSLEPSRDPASSARSAARSNPRTSRTTSSSSSGRRLKT
jgi:hypothetical protein